MTPWLPEHQLLQPESPAEVTALQTLVSAMHNKCMQSELFMCAVQREAGGMTARQVEQLQVCAFNQSNICVLGTHFEGSTYSI